MSLVSVVIPCYNAARFLPGAIESALAQTHRDREIIVVDDGSSDETPAVARAYGDRVAYHRQDNRGAAAARNRGMELARGEFIAFLDADDVWFPTKLEEELGLLARNPALGAVYTDCFSIDSAGKITGFYLARNLPRNPDAAVELFIRDFIPNSTLLFRREALRTVGFSDPAVWLEEDLDYKIRLAERYPIGRVRLPLAGWRQHPGNKSLMVGKILSAFDHDTDIICGKVPRLKRWRRKREAVMRENCGFLLLRDGDARSARSHFLAAARLDPRRGRCYLMAAVSLLGSPAARTVIALKKRALVAGARAARGRRRPGDGSR